ncbi:phosphoglycolate phosphatase [Ruminococcus flavefaciens]|uniref:Phosphoglycolate phosphatase n=1 Tax=Ruminococcus flavefaciens TaxID=1265 RepID=A0A1H6HWC1_RUMFL|nr:HAD family hydrolase [Ruminococcus flavefaciens]SEH38453.1 phosphoglycolate phosphatase [Ruminococcus flavefaciens]
MKKGIIFDMDGTLWDSSANVAASWTEIVRKSEYDLPDITQEDVMGVMGLTMDRIADKLFSSLSQKERMELLEQCCNYENDYLLKHGGVLYPQLEKTFIRLKEKYHLYIVSNCQKGYIETFLEHYSFGKYFDDIECYGNNLKSKGDNIALVVKRNKLDKSWYVGDIQGDYDATMQAGIDFIHAAYGFGKIKQTVPELAKFSDLPELMETLQ